MPARDRKDDTRNFRLELPYWERFKDKCKDNGLTASERLRQFILAEIGEMPPLDITWDAIDARIDARTARIFTERSQNSTAPVKTNPTPPTLETTASLESYAAPKTPKPPPARSLDTPAVGDVWDLDDAVRFADQGRRKFLERLERGNHQFAWEWCDREAQTVRYRGKLSER